MQARRVFKAGDGPVACLVDARSSPWPGPPRRAPGLPLLALGDRELSLQYVPCAKHVGPTERLPDLRVLVRPGLEDDAIDAATALADEPKVPTASLGVVHCAQLHPKRDEANEIGRPGVVNATEGLLGRMHICHQV